MQLAVALYSPLNCRKFLSSDSSKGIVSRGAETHLKAVDWSDRSTAVLFGDSVGGVLLEASETRHLP